MADLELHHPPTLAHELDRVLPAHESVGKHRPRDETRCLPRAQRQRRIPRDHATPRVELHAHVAARIGPDWAPSRRLPATSATTIRVRPRVTRVTTPARRRAPPMLRGLLRVTAETAAPPGWFEPRKESLVRRR